MGFITTLVSNNDLTHELLKATNLRKDLYHALLQIHGDQKPVEVPGTGITVVETHHADYAQPVLVGGQRAASVIGGVSIFYKVEDQELSLLQQLAQKHGYELHKKRKR